VDNIGEVKMKEVDYNALIDMFESDGWTLFIKDIEEGEKANTKGAVDGATTNDAWQWLRGYLTCARNTLAFETFVRLSYEQQLKDLEDEDEYDATL